MNQRGFANITLVLVIVILVGAVGYFAFVKKSELGAKQPTPTSTQKIQIPTPIPTPDKISTWKTYTNSRYGYELKYPENVGYMRSGEGEDYLGPLTDANAQTDNLLIGYSNSDIIIMNIEVGSSGDNDNYFLSNKTYWSDPTEVKINDNTFQKYITVLKSGAYNGRQKVYVTQHNGVNYFVGLWISGMPDQILSTFKFTN